MRTIYQSCLFALLLVLASPGNAQSLFYQPLQRDQSVSDAQWQAMWRDVRAEGYQQLIVQWTRHDNEDFGGQGGWLNRALQQAEQAGLSLILGLHYESDYYSVLEQHNSSVYFWHHLLSQSRQQQKRLKHWQLRPVAWYIPYELDDTLYRSHDMLREIGFQLASFLELDQRPVHISAFASGQLSPRVYADWLSTIGREGVHVWWQDGRGTGRLPVMARDAYQAALPCDVGIVHEAFEQTSADNERFAAQSANAFSRPQPSAVCHPQAVFSLRYLPLTSGALQ